MIKAIKSSVFRRRLLGCDIVANLKGLAVIENSLNTPAGLIRILFGIIWLTLTPLGHTQAETLNWEQLVELALQNSPAIQQSKQELIGKEKLYEKTKGNFYPEISFGVTSSRLQSDDLSEKSNTASLSFSQNLFNGFRDVKSLEISQKNSKIAELTLSQRKQQALSELKIAAATLIQRRDLLKLAKEIAERQHNNQRIVELRFEVGRENKGSVLLSKANSTDANFEVLSADEQLQSAKKYLSDLAGLSPEQTFSGPLPTKSPPEKINVFKLLEDSYSEKKSQLELGQAGADIDQAKSSLWPKVDFSVSSTSKTANFFNEPRQNRYALSMNLSLFSGFKDVRTIEFFQSQKLATIARQKATLTQRSQNLEKAAQAWRDAYRSLESSKAFVKAQTLRTEIARSKYSNGLLSFDEWNNIEKELIGQQKALINAEKNIVVAESNFEDILIIGGN